MKISSMKTEKYSSMATSGTWPSPTPCSRRVKQLEEAGIIRRRVTLLDESMLGLKLVALVQVSMDGHTPDRLEGFEETVRGYPEVVACYLITGQASDYVLKVVVPDMETYQAFLLGRLTRIPGVTGVQSSFILRKAVDRTELPLDYAFRQSGG